MRLRVAGTSFEREASSGSGAVLPRGAVVAAEGRVAWVHFRGEIWRIEKAIGARREADADHRLEAPMPGRIAKVLVKAGDAVTKGTTLLVLEAMKMEHEIRAPRGGTVMKLHRAAGEMVALGDLLAEVE